MRILCIEPFFAGSHKLFIEGLIKHSSHEIIPLTQPGRNWKWRMRSSAILLAAVAPTDVDLILASDYLSLAEFLSLAPSALRDCPSITYFHENQLGYPLQDYQTLDVHFVMTHITTMLASTSVAFNSEWHKTSFFNQLHTFLKTMPEKGLPDVEKKIEAKSCVLNLGVDYAHISENKKHNNDGRVCFVWNHRWEHDKAPEIFFDVCNQLSSEGLAFGIIILGERFRNTPECFDEAKVRLEKHIEHFGFAESRSDYADALARGDVIVSTSIHEYFGISVCEGIAAGLYPLLPKKLSYTEILAPLKEMSENHLYENETDLLVRMRTLCMHPKRARAKSFAHIAKRFEWSEIIKKYDSYFEETINATCS